MAWQEALRRLSLAFARQRRLRRAFPVPGATLFVALLLAGVAAAGAWVVFSTQEAAVVVEDRVDVLDTDGDGVPDAAENAFLGTDPFEATARGALPLAWIRAHALDPTDPALGDRLAPYPTPPESPAAYGPDGLPAEMRMTLAEVYAHGRPGHWDEARDGPWDSKLDPNAWDVEGSGVPYAWLIHHGLDPLDPSLLDRVADGAEVQWTVGEAYQRGLHPLLRDGDQDGLDDERELELGTSPLRNSTAGTGILDGWLVAHGFDPLDAAVAYQDADRDGLSNLEEFRASVLLDPSKVLVGGGLDPRKLSTVDGPIPDGWLVRYGLDALDPGVAQQVTERLEADNATLVLRVLDEYRVNRPPLWNESANGPWMGGTDPASPDTDDDGLGDAQEILGWVIQVGGSPKRVASDPTRADTDGDGLSDKEEREGRVGDREFPRTDPGSPDTDFDGLTDGQEVGEADWNGLRLPALDPTREDTDADGLLDGREAGYWLSRHDRYARQQLPYEWGPPGASRTAAQALARPGATASDILASLLPDGDADRDGLQNLLDPDSDGDGLQDGWEVDPVLYRDSPYAAPQPRRTTDPANADTDGDGLPDVWETRYGVFDEQLGGWNLDAALWSSFGDDVSDADRDLDEDGTTWYSFHAGGGSGARRIAHVFTATNLIEFEAGSDPNRFSSSPDGIADGWKIFWGTVYLGLAPEELGTVYPGAPGELSLPTERPPPGIGEEDLVLLGQRAYVRFQPVETSRLLPGETMTLLQFVDAAGQSKTARQIRGEINYDYRAAAGNFTNPYLDDTDGDGIPDTWEALWSQLGEVRTRVSPVAADASLDADGDGLDSLAEYSAGSDPYRVDSDLGGASDGIEATLALNAMDPADDAESLSSSRDDDGDGVSNAAEILGQKPTDPQDPDTDRDGLLDGKTIKGIRDAALVERLRARGIVLVENDDGSFDALGEVSYAADPTRLSTSGEGIPDGWIVKHGQSPAQRSGLLNAYSYGRPSWWNESAHGSWWWGLNPGQSATRDHDHDGLDDLNGEDPLPYANWLHAPPLGDPREPGLDDVARLLRAQAYGNDSALSASGVPPRVGTILVLDPLPDDVTADGTTWFHGNLTTVKDNPATGKKEPVANVTVVLALERRGLVVGVAVTNETGGFGGPIRVGASATAPEGSEGVPVFGALDGAGLHVNDEDRLRAIDPAREVKLFAWSYNVSHLPPARQAFEYAQADDSRAFGVMGSESTKRQAFLVLPTEIQADPIAPAPLGGTVRLNLTLRDGLQRPLVGADVTVEPGHGTLVTDADGRATLDLRVPSTPGPYVLNLTYAGENTLLPTQLNVTVSVLADTSLLLTPPPRALDPGSSFAVRGSLLSVGGVGVRDAPVVVEVVGQRHEARTTLTGTFQVIAQIPADYVAPDARVTAVFAGNETLAPAKANVTLAVQPAASWNFSLVAARLGETVEVQARLTDSAGSAMSGRLSTLALGPLRLEGHTDDQGRVRFRVPTADIGAGERLARLRHASVDGLVAEADVPVRVSTTTDLTLRADDAIRGDRVAVSGRLADALGRGVAGQPIVLRLGPSVAQVATDADGAFRANLLVDGSLRPGRANVHAEYAGTPDAIFLSSRATFETAVRDAAVIDLADRVVRVASPALSGRVTTRLGEPLVGIEVVAHGAWGSTSAIASQRGEFSMLLPLPRDQPLGPFSTNVSVSSQPLLVGATNDEKLLLKDAATLSLRPAAAVLAGDALRMEASLRDSRGLAVPGFTVTVWLDDQLLLDNATPPLAPRIPASTVPGPHVVHAMAFSPYAEAPGASAKVAVQRETRMTVENVPRVRPGEPGEALLRLEGQDGPLGAQSVLVFGAGPAPLRLVTDGEGIVRVPIEAKAFGVATYEVVFPGEGSFAPAAANIHVQAAASAPAEIAGFPWWVAVLVAALLVVGALVVAVRRGRTPEAVLARASRRLSSQRPDVRALYDAYLALLSLAGMDEDAAETITFRQIVQRFLRDAEGATDDLDLLGDVFEQALYAEGEVPLDRVHAAGAALDRLSTRMRPAGGEAA